MNAIQADLQFVIQRQVLENVLMRLDPTDALVRPITSLPKTTEHASVILSIYLRIFYVNCFDKSDCSC